MKKIVTLFIALASVAPMVSAQPFIDGIRQSHTEANVPAEKQFNAFLKRDLLSYFKREVGPATTAVEYQLLRSAPTQSGVASPKYYLWVRAVAGSALAQEGAVRVAAVGQTHFEVTNFMPATSIREQPNQVSAVFPAALVPLVLSKAGAK